MARALTEETEVPAFARYLATILLGLIVQNASGATKAQMQDIADITLRHSALDLLR